MIERALKELPNNTGNVKDIIKKIEKKFSDTLNWKVENDQRQTPVWKSSVRKILFSNQRFKKVAGGNYTLA